MRNNHHNPNKVPPFKPDPEHWTKKVHSWKAKVAYETEDDAWEFLNQIPRLKALGWHPYLCKDCFFFKDGVCNDPNEVRFTSEENPSCISFEYKTIVERL